MLRVTVKLPRSGFMVGENIPVTVFVENHIRKRIDLMQIR